MLNYKQGTANNKIIQLREHLTRSNTVSNPNFLKEEQAIIDSMFSEKSRQASRENSNFSSNLYNPIHVENSNKRGEMKVKIRNQAKAASVNDSRGVNSAAGSKARKIRNSNTNRVLIHSASKKNANSQSEFLDICK